MNHYTNLRGLLDGDCAACDYFDSLPSGLRDALRRQESITSFAEMQSFVSDERETPFF